MRGNPYDIIINYTIDIVDVREENVGLNVAPGELHVPELSGIPYSREMEVDDEGYNLCLSKGGKVKGGRDLHTTQVPLEGRGVAISASDEGGLESERGVR